MSQPIPLNEVSKQSQIDENELEQNLKLIEQKRNEVEETSKALKIEVQNLHLQKTVLEKKNACLDLANFEKEKDNCMLKTKIKEAAYSLDSIRWKITKIKLLKEFESQQHEIIKKKMTECKQINRSTTPTEIENTANIMYNHLNKKGDTDHIKQLKEKVKDLEEKIEAKERAIKMTNPKLYTDIQMLQKRNAALLLRYQRQVEEAESRHRQALCELNSLKKVLADKNYLMSNLDES